MRFSLGVCTILTARLILSPAQDANVSLMKAAGRGDLKQVRRLLGNGAQVNGRDSNGKTALHFAVHSKNVLVVDALIQAGADLDAKADGNVTALMLSVDMAFGDPDIALRLIRAGADVQAADTNGDTALIVATTESSLEVVKALLEKGANPNAKGLGGETALHYAAMNAMLDQAKLLLEHRAHPNILNSAGKSAYDLAYTTNPDPKVQASFQKMRSLLSNASSHATVNSP